jgi:hypothetical protein|tara:strand:- start:630 stop:1982 length:1353 start_codon:yes stop_codon:yes gene_type:complete
MITKVGFPGGTEWHLNGWLLMMLAIVACGLFVSLAVEKASLIPEANADKSEFHKHYCSEHNADPANCIPDENTEAPDQSRAEEMEKDIEEQADDLNEKILDQKEVIEKAMQAILDQKKLAGENFIKMNQEESNEKSLKQDHRTLTQQIKQKKFTCRDIVAFGNYTETKKARDECNEELDDMKENLKKIFEEWRQSLIDKKKTKQDYWESYDAIGDVEKIYKEEKEKLEDLKAEFRKTVNKTHIIGLRLSGTCDITIKNHWEATQLNPDHHNSSNCLTYRDLIAYDNSIKAISGDFEDLGWDLNRMKPGLTNTYEYYKQFPWAKWIIVDPDGSIMSNAALITVQPNNVQWLKSQLESNKSESIDFDKMEQYVMEDIMVSADCRHASVSPKMEAVNTIVSHFMEHCTPPADTWQIVKTIKLVFLEGLGIMDEQSQMAINWYAEKAREIAMMR